MKKNKYFYFFFISCLLIIFLNQKSIANENKKFLSLKKNVANVRVGPSRDYPIKYTYKKKIFTIRNFR